MVGVSAENVSKIYAPGRSAPAVSDLSLEVHDGEFLVLVGPSGCGKSTTLRLIAGLEAPTRGDIRIGDRRVNDVPPSERDIAMVFQSYALYPHMTVRENMAFALTLRRMPRARIADRVHRAARMLALEQLLERRPGQLSGGQRQRVALGRAIVREPQVFLFDEPLSNLDAALRAQMRRELALLHRTLGTTMIYVTHDQVEAMTLGQRIAVMNEGRLLQVDTPRALYDRPGDRFTAGFIGSPGMNFARVEVDEATGGARLRSSPGTILRGVLGPGTLQALNGQDVELGVRAEDIALGDSADSPDSVPAVVEYVETLGSEALAHVVVGRSPSQAGVPFLVRVPAREVPGVGTPVALRLAAGRMHLFDPATGRRLEP